MSVSRNTLDHNQYTIISSMHKIQTYDMFCNMPQMVSVRVKH